MVLPLTFACASVVAPVSTALYSLYSLYRLNTLYRPYSLYSLYSLYGHYSLNSLNRLYTLYNLYSLYRLNRLDRLYSSTASTVYSALQHPSGSPVVDVSDPYYCGSHSASSTGRRPREIGCILQLKCLKWSAQTQANARRRQTRLRTVSANGRWCQ